MTLQYFPEIPGRGPETATASPQTPGVHTRVGHVAYTTSPLPVAATGTITVASDTFAGPTTILLGEFVLTTDEEFSTTGAAVQATGVLTVVATPSTATITIGGTALTDAGGARTPGSDDYDGTLATPALIAADIVAAINDGANSFAGIATAIDGGGGAVNLTAVPIGTLGNAVTLATSDVGDVTVSGALMTGGEDTTEVLATSLSDAIDVLPVYSAVAAASVVTVTGPFGIIGNHVVFKSDGSSPANFTFAPTDGSLAGAEPTIGPPLIG
jgi:hypothetical protein